MIMIYEVNKNGGKKKNGVRILTDKIKEAGFLLKVTMRTMEEGSTLYLIVKKGVKVG